MLETNTLSDLSIFSHKISAVIADIDYTLMDFAVAQRAAVDSLVPKYGEAFADCVDDTFMLINEEHQHKDTATWAKKREFEEVIQTIKDIEAPSLAKYGLKRWSRESWMIIVSRKLGINLDAKGIEKCRDTYWGAHAKNSRLYPDAVEFLKELESRSIPLILMTSSDSVMKVTSDLTLTYDPDFSGSYKMKRIDILPLKYKSIILGERVDKPSVEFFDLVYKEVSKLGDCEKRSVLFVGDSPKSDLSVPEKDGYSTLLIKR